MPIQKILKVGNSLGVTLPANFVKGLSLKQGDSVDVSQEMSNSLTLVFIDSHQLSLGLNQPARRGGPKKVTKKQI